MEIGKDAVTVTVIGLLLVSIPVAFGLASLPPSIFLGSDPLSQNVQPGGSTTFKIAVYPQGDWKIGNVTLALVDPPQGVTATFNPEKMVDMSKDGASSNLTVNVAANAPQGTITLAVRGTGIAYQPVGTQATALNATTYVTLNIAASTSKTTTTNTTTNTTTTTVTNVTTTTTTKNSTTTGSTSTATVTSFVTTTVTTTSVSTTTVISTQSPQQQLQPGTDGYFVFGIGALAVSSVLFILGVLLLAANRKH